MRQTVFYIIFALTIQACGATPITALPSPSKTVVPTATMTSTPTIIVSPTITPIPGKADRVIIISFDGLRPDAITEAPMNNLIHWMRNGAYTFEARTINPSLTQPAHSSMLSGLCASQHGVTWNSGLVNWGYSKGVDIFDLAHAAEMRTVMIVGKDKLRQLAEPETTDVFEVHSADIDIFQAAIDQLSLGFNLMFIHIPSADDRGHQYGWMSNAQLKVLRESDVFLGDFITALDQLGLTNSTSVIITSDHGGDDKGHDGSELEDQLIPWSIVGPGVEAEKIKNIISITDTAATAAYILNLPLQPEWAGIPVYEAFGMFPTTIHESIPCIN